MYPKMLKMLKLRSMQVFLVAATLLITLVTSVLCLGLLMRFELVAEVSSVDGVKYWLVDVPPEQLKWYDKGIDELRKALHESVETNVAKNLLLIMVRGVGPAALAAARFPENSQESGNMLWDTFPHHGRLKNTCSQFASCDYFTQGTALFGGVKTNFRIGGLDSFVSFGNCTQASDGKHRVVSIIEQAQVAGKRTALITTQRVTGPSVAALYALSPDTRWECSVAEDDCDDVAHQLVHGAVGLNINVIFGGGRQVLLGTGGDSLNCSTKGNLLSDWSAEQFKLQRKYSLLEDRTQLLQMDGQSIDYVMGIFAEDNIVASDVAKPTLEEMVLQAMQVLKSNDTQGYAMVIESNLNEAKSLGDKAKELRRLNRTLTQIEEYFTDDTLVLICYSDESGGEDNTELPTDLLTLLGDDSELARLLKSMPSDSIVFAKGPYSYLLHGVHEETYLAHLMAFSSEIGRYKRLTK